MAERNEGWSGCLTIVIVVVLLALFAWHWDNVHEKREQYCRNRGMTLIFVHCLTDSLVLSVPHGEWGDTVATDSPSEP